MLAVASGHKLHFWEYTKPRRDDQCAPAVALKTRRSLRAVHFHPQVCIGNQTCSAASARALLLTKAMSSWRQTFQLLNSYFVPVQGSSMLLTAEVSEPSKVSALPLASSGAPDSPSSLREQHRLMQQVSHMHTTLIS